MKTSKKAIRTQIKILDRKINDLISLGNMPRPRSGWLRAIRTALGLSSRQLGNIAGVTHQVIIRLEKGEIEGSISLDSIQKLAKAMDCRLIYAIVPEKHASLNAILDEKAMTLAKKIMKDISHSMKLEDQGVDAQTISEQINSLAKDLKDSLDPRLWSR